MDKHIRNSHRRQSSQAKNMVCKSSNKIFVKTVKLILNTENSFRLEKEREREATKKVASFFKQKCKKYHKENVKLFL